MDRQKTTRRIGVAGQAAALGVLLASIAPAQAQNIVQNPNFTADLPPWALFLSGPPDPTGAGSATWTAAQDANDAIGSSGAAQVDLDAAPSTAHAAAGIHQCIAFPTTTVLEANYGARFKIPASDATNGSVGASVEIRFFSDAGCTQFIPGAGGTQGRAIVAGVPDDAFWYSAGDSAFQLPANTVAQSAEVRASLRKLGTSSQPYTGYFDDIYLSLNGSVPVSLQSFDVD